MAYLHISAGDLRSILGWSEHKVRRLLATPFPLPFSVSPAKRQGGNQVRLYDFAFLLPRLRWETDATEEQIAKITLIANGRYRSAKENQNEKAY